MSADPAKTFFPSFETFTHVASAVNFATVPIIKKGKNVKHDVGVYKKLFSNYLVSSLYSVKMKKWRKILVTLFLLIFPIMYFANFPISEYFVIPFLKSFDVFKKQHTLTWGSFRNSTKLSSVFGHRWEG